VLFFFWKSPKKTNYLRRGNMAFVLGIDIGSASSKGIVLNEQGLSGSFECPSGGDFKLTAERKDRETKLRRKYIGVEEALKV